MRVLRLWLLLAASTSFLLACDQKPPNNPETPEGTLNATDHLVRASMALRGIRPSVEELLAVRKDPGALPGIVDGYLQAPEFGETIKELHNEDWLTRADNIVFPAVGPLQGTSLSAINRSLADQPLELVRYVVENDLPYTDILTADYTVADPIAATVWGLPHSASDDWEVTNWQNGEPAAGVLADSWIFVRHRSAGFNYNRGRANRVTQALICYDFLQTDVVIDGAIDLSDPDAIADAVQNNEACATCHSSLDPLAGFFFPHQQINPGNIQNYPLQLFNPARSGQWQNTTQVPPAYFGVPGADLSDLAASIASDPQFASCAAQRFYSYLAEVEPTGIPYELISQLSDDFVASGYNARSLAREVVLSDEFKKAYSTDPVEADALVGYKKARPAQLGRMMEDLTGFVWQAQLGPFGTVDLPTNSLLGFEVLGGGIDSFFVTEPSHTMNATSSLLLRSFAAEAAGYVVENDFNQADPASRKLLTRVNDSDTDETAIRDQLVDLHIRFYAEFYDANAPEIDESYALFADALSRTGDVRHAWKTTLTGMLQDIKVAYY